jgi:hypothetical protein
MAELPAEQIEGPKPQDDFTPGDKAPAVPVSPRVWNKLTERRRVELAEGTAARHWGDD